MIDLVCSKHATHAKKEPPLQREPRGNRIGSGLLNRDFCSVNGPSLMEKVGDSGVLTGQRSLETQTYKPVLNFKGWGPLLPPSRPSPLPSRQGGGVEEGEGGRGGGELK